MPKFDIPVIVQVEAESYEEALSNVSDWSDRLKDSQKCLCPKCRVLHPKLIQNYNVPTEFDYSDSLSGSGQRVLYLHPESEPVEY